MTTEELLLKLKYRFRDYFFPDPQYGTTGSLVGMDDLLNEYTENNYVMKVEFKINKQKLIAINHLLAPYDNIDINSLKTAQKVAYSLRKELRNIFVKKTINCQVEKEFKMKLPYYLANELFTVLLEYCNNDNTTYLTGLDTLKNQLHQKLL